ncbi:aminoglycoside phosphotransferase family protein [Nesterenkonia marinintestina]|uniref:aminoglycoside phosphotransferase family protein n=1 Tax=Nesterenkonia marinintestina TaxID=2979865 RepID=UPI0021BF404D|nr:aminoglycoside phosphotransferase family protein [Nesterenkonia sp. GX14115]
MLGRDVFDDPHSTAPQPDDDDPVGGAGDPGVVAALDRRQLESEQLALLQSSAVFAPVRTALRDFGVAAAQLQVESVQHRPGAGVTGIYRVEAEGAEAERLFLGATTEPVDDRAGGVVVVDSPVGLLSVWRHPGDPALPGLHLAADPAAVISEWGEGRALRRLETVSYRPLRRAVILAEFDDGDRLYLKALRRGAAARLDHRHRMLAAAGLPVPVPARGPRAEVVALPDGGGLPLAEAFLADGAAGVDPGLFLDLLDGLPAEVMDLSERPSWTDRLPAYAAAASSALPECADRIRVLAGRIAAELPLTEAGPLVPTHGDFYEANILMEGEAVGSLLDVDSLGPGRRIDDLACFLGHLAVLPAVDARYIHVPEAFARFAAAFSGAVDAHGLRLRSAAVALSLVAGARDGARPGWAREAEHRLDCAESILGPVSREPAPPQWPDDTRPLGR